MLGKLTVDDFRAVVGQAFAIAAADGGRLELELIEARLIDPGSAPTDDAGHRAPFAIDLRGPTDPVLPQATYRLQNDTLGELDLFMVPVGRSEAGTDYEAIFT